MTARQVVTLLLIAVAGYALLSLIYPAAAPATKLDIRMSREQAIATARQHVVALYPDAGSWASSVKPTVSEVSLEYLRRNPRPEIARFTSPIAVDVTFLRPGTTQNVEVRLGADGKLKAIKQTTVSSEAQTTPTRPSKPQEEQKTLAEAALQRIAGADWSGFVFKSVTAGGEATRTFTWEKSIEGDDRLKLIAEATIENDTVTRSSIAPDASGNFTSGLRRGGFYLDISDVLFVAFFLLSLLIALIVYFRHLINHEVRHSSTLLVLAVAFLISLTGMLVSPIFDSIYSSMASQPALAKNNAAIIVAVVVCTLMALFVSFPFFILWGGGYPEAQGRVPNSLRTLELCFRGKLHTREVGAGLLTGIALGWVLPMLSAVVGRIGFGTDTRLAVESNLGDLFFSRAPLLTLPFESTRTDLFIACSLFAFSVPFLLRRLPNATLVHGLAIAIGTLCVLGSDEFYTGVIAVVLTSLLTFVFLDRLTVRSGLLASVAALLAGNFAAKLSLLSVVSVATLQQHAWVGWAVLALLLLATAAVTLRGKVLNEVQAQALWFQEDQSVNREERQRLKAQFQVAKMAQQQMLPSSPPSIQGVEIAADCRPAREVGGDLFDFLQLPNGRVGIVVADVSGKGVPASLYMTLTKGLLASAAETTADPGEMLREVNRHLYEACQRKMFVTLVLGVVDPELRTFSYVRAGHNPPVWRRASDGKTIMLRAHGIGLGLNAGDVFNRSLQMEEIQLNSHDLLILYSDGISEAMNDRREEYGEERLKSVAVRSDGMNADQIKELILNDVKSFLGRTPPQDDQTLVVVRVK